MIYTYGKTFCKHHYLFIVFHHFHFAVLEELGVFISIHFYSELCILYIVSDIIFIYVLNLQERNTPLHINVDGQSPRENGYPEGPNGVTGTIETSKSASRPPAGYPSKKPDQNGQAGSPASVASSASGTSRHNPQYVQLPSTLFRIDLSTSTTTLQTVKFVLAVTVVFILGSLWLDILSTRHEFKVSWLRLSPMAMT